ncbi:hypothetical protein ASZ90_015064 [hydrocarbon metagenome]|uniref:Uncharacterized protein n=1 Tax=hydrocarbon metagenome TaxID=938273 RepID=A0A0W8F346_9ZZZZ
MMSPGGEDPGQAAFRLFEEGKYRESLELCQAGGQQIPETQRSILVAQNLFHLGRIEEAECFVRDLLCTMPDSSYLHSFLGKILLKKDEDAAVAEYVRAVSLDPANQDALRSYALYLVSMGDACRAIPVQRRLATLSGREEDVRALIRSLTAAGQAREALSLYHGSVRRKDADGEYIAALMGAGSYADAAREAVRAYRSTGLTDFARTYLRALAMKDREGAVREYREFFSSLGDPGIGYDFAELLVSLGRTPDALGVCRELLDADRAGPHPRIRLLVCRLNAASGERDKALGCYEYLVKDALQALDDPAFLTDLLSLYREFLLTYFPVKTAVQRFIAQVSPTPHVVCLLATARLYEDIGDAGEAKSSYYRAFRSDYHAGGMAYARFLARQKDIRECEKVLLYVLNTIKKTRELESAAAFILDEEWRLYRQVRLRDRIVQALEAHLSSLGSSGLEYLSVGYLVSASSALREQDYQACKEFCLRGLDIVPVTSSHIRPEDFVDLLKRCKEEAIGDLPIMEQRSTGSGTDEREEVVRKFIETCDEQERTVIRFLREHHEASEMDLRRLLNTRRVVGIMNRIIQKASASGIVLIEKRGTGEGGEVYGYHTG